MSLPAGFWSKAYIITSEEEAEGVAKVIPENRSTKAIPNNIPCILFIVTDLCKYNKLHVIKNRKAFIYPMMNVYRGTWVTCPPRLLTGLVLKYGV
jgi:hypothetical protein